MANEVRKITLTQLGSDAGPNFSVEYSVDCSSYTASADCTNIFLPNVGSFAYCTVDENTTCIKLTSKGACTNAVIENPSVTSTTTAAPTTTTTLSPTTTTTLGPATTSTTLAPTTTTTTCAIQAYAYELTQTATNPSVDYIDPYGQSRNISWVSSGTKRYIAARSITSATNVSTSSLGIPYGFICDTGSLDFCQQVITGVTSSFTFNAVTHVYYLSGSNGVPQFAIVQNAFSTIAITECMVSGSLILPSPNTSNWDINYEADCSCPITTTTLAPTTTTLAPTTTTTTFACPSCDEYLIENYSQVPGDTLTVQYIDCDTQTIAEALIPYDSSGYVCSCNTPIRISGPTSIAITNVGSCPTTTTTLSPTTTTTLSPTTSTTLAPTTTTTECPATIYTHGAVRGTCNDYCTTNYLIQTQTCADNSYFSLTIGDTIYGYTSAGYVAYSNVSTDTDTGPFRIAEIDSNGVVLDISVCSGNACVPL